MQLCRKHTIEASGEDYNVYVPIVNAFGAIRQAGSRPQYDAAQDGSIREPLETGS
jgi:hypothetical protein